MFLTERYLNVFTNNDNDDDVNEINVGKTNLQNIYDEKCEKSRVHNFSLITLDL